MNNNNIVDLNLTNNFLNSNKELINEDNINKFIDDKSSIIYDSIKNNIIKACNKENAVKTTKTKAYSFSKILLQNSLKLKFTVEKNLFTIINPQDQTSQNISTDYSFPSRSMNPIVVKILNKVSLFLSNDNELIKVIKSKEICKYFDGILPLIKSNIIINDNNEEIINSKFSAKFITNSEIVGDNKFNILEGYKCFFFDKSKEINIKNKNELDAFLPRGSTFNILITPSQLMNYPIAHKNKVNIVWKIELIQLIEKPKTNEIDPKRYLENIIDDNINDEEYKKQSPQKEDYIQSSNIVKNINNIMLDDFNNEEEDVDDSEDGDETNNNLINPPSLNKKLIKN